MLNTKTIGTRITEARKRTNISQAALAERLFISPQAVGKWERGESMPDIITLNRLAEILGVDLNYFSDGKQPADVRQPVSNEINTTEKPDIHNEVAPSAREIKKLSWDMSLANWADADFSGLKNLHEKFSASNMQRCLFIGSDLQGLHLKSNHIVNCDFSGSNLSGSHIQTSHLNNNAFKECSLSETLISASHITGCDFSGADFTGVELKFVTFQKNKIVDTVWKRTIFKLTHVADVVFSGSVEDCYFDNCSFNKVTFQNATLINTFFKNKNLKRVNFIDCQADRLTFEFLKNGKADMSGVTRL